MDASSAEHVLEQSAPFLVSLGINELSRVWERIEPMLARACEESHGEFTLDQILSMMGIHDGVERWRLLAIIDGAHPKAVMVVCITQQPSGRKVLDCLLASGEDAKSWSDHDEAFDAIARECGCVAVRVPFARIGWVRTLPHWRIVAKGYVLEREV